MDIKRREKLVPRADVQLLWRQPTTLHRQVFAWWSHLLRKPIGEMNRRQFQSLFVVAGGITWMQGFMN